LKQFTFTAESEAETMALGAALAAVLPEGATVALRGTLGAGKTRLVQAIAAALGVDRRGVVSPTFVLVQEYQGRRRICHVDAYRLADQDEFFQLGVDEFFESDALVLIEWAERISKHLPAERIEVEISIRGRQSRQFDVTALGLRYAGVLDRLAAALFLPQ
jgi:tRNA threonylcarbamoyladenosine biosynthesis protein TsaE